MAAWISSQGWPVGSKIAIIGKNSAHWLMADLAIWMAGHVSVPIYSTFNAAALRYVLEHSESRACFVGKLDDLVGLSGGVPSDVLQIVMPLAPVSVRGDYTWEGLIAQHQPMTGAPLPDGDALATIVYTSGTTGNPKGVMQTFNALAWAVSAAGERFKFTDRERMLSYLPMAHIAERCLVEHGMLRHGGHIYFAESLETFVQDIQRARPTLFFSVPRLWVKFQQAVYGKIPARKLNRLLSIPLVGWLLRRKLLKGLGLDQVRIALGGASPMPADVLKWYRDLGLELLEVYGMTENCGLNTSTLPGTYRPGTVGVPYVGVETRIDQASGEIQMRSPAVMLGYFKEPAQTAAALTEDGWLRTGDKGVRDADGCIRIVGRVKDIFKSSKGKYVAPAPIEDLLVVHPDVEACVVTGANFPQPFGIVMLSAASLKRVEDAAAHSALMESLARHLEQVNSRQEGHERLAFLVVTRMSWTPENGMVTPTFKVKRAMIEETYGGYYATWTAQGKPVIWGDN